MSKPILLTSAGVCALTLGLAGVAHADPAPTKTVASIAPEASSGPTATTPDERDTTSETEHARVRGGFSLNGGGAFGLAQGPVVSLALRLGVQVNRLFGVYYQQSPMIFLASNDNGVAAGFLDLNSVLGSVTLADMLDIAAGPSLDYYAAGGCGSADCSAGSGWQLGVHGRLALNLGGRDKETGRRSGLSIGLDEHPMFGAGSVLALTTLGIGGEWY
jgi:hypothetical protein